jgi:hypothetical protein
MTAPLPAIVQESPYQHIVVVTSIVLGLAVTQLLKGVAQLYGTRHRIRTYWIHWGWIGLLLLFGLLLWWRDWNFRGVPEWSFFLFVLYLCPMIAFYYLTAIVIPDPNEPVTDFKEYYFSNRVGFFGIFALYGVLAIVTASLVRDLPVLDPTNIFRLALVLLTLVLARSSSERVHGTVLILCAGLLVTFILLYQSRLG